MSALMSSDLVLPVRPFVCALQAASLSVYSRCRMPDPASHDAAGPFNHSNTLLCLLGSATRCFSNRSSLLYIGNSSIMNAVMIFEASFRSSTGLQIGLQIAEVDSFDTARIFKLKHMASTSPSRNVRWPRLPRVL